MRIGEYDHGNGEFTIEMDDVDTGTIDEVVESVGRRFQPYSWDSEDIVLNTVAVLLAKAYGQATNIPWIGACHLTHDMALCLVTTSAGAYIVFTVHKEQDRYRVKGDFIALPKFQYSIFYRYLMEQYGQE